MTSLMTPQLLSPVRLVAIQCIFGPTSGLLAEKKVEQIKNRKWLGQWLAANFFILFCINHFGSGRNMILFVSDARLRCSSLIEYFQMLCMFSLFSVWMEKHNWIQNGQNSSVFLPKSSVKGQTAFQFGCLLSALLGLSEIIFKNFFSLLKWNPGPARLRNTIIRN